ncbi:hypothetical protein [Tenacibaculum jejuense]|uniref:Uncharacterized protein n=1 Tax=Tenacibaculum jejuense TaxID=584609 RepID=A0A238UDV3_9FLAO|nr:hypothetical protein [Tenacibaculum jejuense]SNR17377.1 conserved protein of unknown function [Tenacibaculum jejuense]
MRYFVLILIILVGCEHVAMDYSYPLSVKNNSDHSINLYLNDNENFVSIYPDTIISNFSERISQQILSKETRYIAGGSANWESIFRVSVPSDTLSIFVIHYDSLNKYSWDEIRNNYEVLKRFDFSLQDLEHINYLIEYPASSSMSEIKQFPKYEE